MQTKNKIFYGWYIVAAGCVAIAMTTGIVSNCFGQFIKPIGADLDITRQQVNMIVTVLSISSMVFAMFWGGISKRINLHRTMCICAVLMPCLYAISCRLSSRPLSSSSP